jgi:tetratricopeptide (TPR) repeat protein
MDLYFQGRALLIRGISPDLLAKARGFFQRALELDPGNVGALVGVGAVDAQVAAGYMTDDPVSSAAAAEASLTKALTLAPNRVYAHLAMVYVLIGTNRAQRGIEELELALALDSNLASARAAMGLAHVYLGRAEETEADILEALRLSPRDASISSWFIHAGGAKACLGEYEAAVVWLRKSIDANRYNIWAYFILAACLAHLGRLDEARQEIRAGLAVNPKFTLRRFRTGLESDNAVFLAQRERLIEGMRKAGLPEE